MANKKSSPAITDKAAPPKVLSISEDGGSVSLELEVSPLELATLGSKVEHLDPIIKRKIKEAGTVIRRQELIRGDLDLVDSKAASEQLPEELYKKSIKYYYDEDLYGSVIRLLTNFSASGFQNDTDDDVIKDFFDAWGFDIGLDAFVDQLFFDFYRTGFVRTYKQLGSYVPGISIYPPATKRETSARKKRWSKSSIPLKYTILNPLSVEISGSIMFGSASTYLKASALAEIKALLEKEGKTPPELEMIRRLPSEMKTAAQDGKPYLLDPFILGELDYRPMPYERYPRPRGINAFESINYKRALRRADYSTLDGITNYILLITVGNDDFPVTSQEVLENVASLFDTSSKAFNIVWNHTLKVQKIVSPEIEAILGKRKYEQVNDDYTGALGIVRSVIDGASTASAASVGLAVKSLAAEVSYARRQVRRWLYREYAQVAGAVGFDRIPTVRFNDIELHDEIELIRLMMGLIDRRIISYETGVKKLNYDWNTEKYRLTEEKPLVLDGDFGIIGSPYNPKSAPPMANEPNVQDNQRTPKGTPSEGRPVGTGKPKAGKNTVASVFEEVSSMSAADKETLLRLLQGEL